jgi:hypothetical protein
MSEHVDAHGGREVEDEAIWVVDRIEGAVVVLVEEGSGASVDVARARLGANAEAGEEDGEGGRGDLRASVNEGAVLRVPMVGGVPDWGRAHADERLRRERLEEARDLLDELKRRDPGGDVVL